MSVPLRSPDVVMRLSRMGRMFPHRLSFMRILLRQIAAEGAKVERVHWDINDEGYGEAVYSVGLSEGTVSLFAMTRPLDESQRSDRVIATAWDAAFVLYDGVPDAAEIERLVQNAPYQEAGRFSENDLVLSRANKSVRLFNSIVESLRNGTQPDVEAVRATGYLMRTTAVYGNGKFGVSDHSKIAGRPILGGAFMAEMLTVWLIRGFTHDLVEFLGGAKLDPKIKRHFGVGNATGLGMAPYLVSHPQLVDSWFQTREKALARVLTLSREDVQFDRLAMLAARVTDYLAEWNVGDEAAMAEISYLRDFWPNVVSALGSGTLPMPSELLNLEDHEAVQELIVSMLIEAHAEVVDGLAPLVATANTPDLDCAMPASELRSAIERDWSWATTLDYEDKAQNAQFWYVSEDKLEPRIGKRHEEPGADRESPLDIARRVKAMSLDLQTYSGSVAEFLLSHPEHRMAAERVQGLTISPFAEIRDNLISETMRPIDILRSKLAMFGASKFDPKSDLWTRITLGQGAPLRSELSPETVDNWWLAALPS